MTIVRINLFGKFSVFYNAQPMTGLDARKVQELFCYLLLYRDQPHPRQALATLLWDEGNTDQPARCLRKALWQLRSAFDSQLDSLSDHLFLVEPEWIQLNPDAHLWLDVAELEQGFAATRAIPIEELQAHHVETLQNAVSLYRGGLQESWYHDWYLYERERLQHIYLSMLDRLMDYCEKHRMYELGLTFGALTLHCEGARERTHRRLMRLYYEAGDRTAALRQYQRCVSTLKDELGVPPTKRTLALYDQIRSDQLLVPTSGPVEGHTAFDSVSFSSPEAMGYLKQLHMSLVEVQRQIAKVLEWCNQTKREM